MCLNVNENGPMEWIREVTGKGQGVGDLVSGGFAPPQG